MVGCMDRKWMYERMGGWADGWVEDGWMHEREMNGTGDGQPRLNSEIPACGLESVSWKPLHVSTASNCKKHESRVILNLIQICLTTPATGLES